MKWTEQSPTGVLTYELSFAEVGGQIYPAPPPPPPAYSVPAVPPHYSGPATVSPVVLYGESMDTSNGTVTYVLERSCSMGWDVQPYTDLSGVVRRGPRLDRAKAELTRSIAGLVASTHFNVVAYDCGNALWRRGQVPATDSNKQSAIAWIMGLQPSGASGTGPAVAIALQDVTNDLVVLISDGAPNCGASGMDGHRRMIRSANTHGAKVHTFGIAASGSYRAFMQRVASDNGGGYVDVP